MYKFAENHYHFSLHFQGCMFKAHINIEPSAVPEGNAGGIFCSHNTMKAEDSSSLLITVSL